MAVKERRAALAAVREAERRLVEDEAVARAHGPAVEAFAETLQEVLGDRPADIDEARRAALQTAAASVWEDTVGPLLTGAQARELLGGVSRQRLGQLLGEGRLIALEKRSGERVFPAWQFRHGQLLRPLVAAHRTLVEEADESPWTAASWCVNAHPELGGQSPLEWAAGDGAAERLLLVAGRDASRLAR
jgi:hypothetical protein